MRPALRSRLLMFLVFSAFSLLFRKEVQYLFQVHVWFVIAVAALFIFLAGSQEEDVESPSLNYTDLPLRPALSPSLSGAVVGLACPVPDHSVTINQLRRGLKKTLVIPNFVRNRHILCFGASGSGKSNFMDTLILQDIEAGIPVTVVDPKGPYERVLRIRAYAEKFGRKFYLFAPHLAGRDKVESWNPLQIARTPDEQTALLTSIFDVTPEAQFYADKAHEVLSILFTGFKAAAIPSPTIEDIYSTLIDENKLRQLMEACSDPHARLLLESLLKEMRSPFFLNYIQNLKVTLHQLRESPELRRFLSPQSPPSLCLIGALHEGAVVYFYLPSAILTDVSNMIGRLIIANYQFIYGRIQLEGQKPIPASLYVDEFGKMLYKNVTTIFQQARGGGLMLFGALQSAAQLVKMLGEAGAKDIISNASTTVFFLPNDFEAELVAEKIGKGLTVDYREITYENDPNDNLAFQAQTRRDFIIESSEVRKLRPGEAFLISAYLGRYFIKVPLVNIFEEKENGRPGQEAA